MSMTSDDARLFVRQFARNAESSDQYGDDEIDRVVQALMDDLVRVTRATFTVDSVTMQAASASLNGFPDGFRAERAMKIWIPGAPPAGGSIERTDISTIIDLQTGREANRQGRPFKLAFDSATTAQLWPTPDIGYTANLMWWEPFTTWTPGQTSGGFNLPDDIVRTALIYGAPALLQHNEPENKYAQASYEKYIAYRDSMIASGALGGSSSGKSRLED